MRILQSTALHAERSDSATCRALPLAKAIVWPDRAFVGALALSPEGPMSIHLTCQDLDRKGTRTFPLALIGSLLLQALVGCGGSSNGQSAVAAPPPTVQSAPLPPPVVRPESGDAWQGRYVGTVTIGDVQYFGDAMLTADGLIRLYMGGPYDGGGELPLAVPASSAQLVGTLHGQTNQISGDGLVFGQECATSDPIRFCAEIGHANMSIAVVSVDSQAEIQGKMLVTTSAGTEPWSLDLINFNNYYVLSATQGGLAGFYKEELAEFALNGDTIISIDAVGMLFFQSPSSGCTGNGQLRPHLDGAVDVYDVSLTISGCDAPHNTLNSKFDGLATISPSSKWDYDANLRMWLSEQDPKVSGSSPPVLTTWAEAQ
jgi:hypothetical protein